MKQFQSLLSKVYPHKVKFGFAKIIKMAPRAGQVDPQQSITRSIKSAKQLFAQFLPRAYSSPLTQTSLESAADDFIQYVNQFNQPVFQNKIMTSDVKVGEMLKKLKNQRILANGIQILVNRKSFTQTQKKYVTNLFLLISHLFKKAIFEGRKIEFDQTFFKEFMEGFNHYMILMDMHPKLILNYLFLINHLIKTKTIDSSRAYFVNQKIVIDQILQNRKTFPIHKRQLFPLFSYLSMGNVIANYPQRYFQFTQFLLQKLDNNWEKDVIFKNKRFINALYSLNYNCEKITKGLKSYIDLEINELNYEIVVLSLNAYLNLEAEIFINKPVHQNILKSLKKISSFIVSMKEKSKNKSIGLQSQDMEYEIYKILIPTLFRTSIWNQQIWLLFADWLDTGKNYQKLPLIQVYTMMDLLLIDKDIIPKTIIERLMQSKNHMLLKNNFRIQDVDLVKVYHKEFGQRMKAFYTSQQQIANNLRSVSKTNIKTESLIHFFMVDILMNDTIIIEINNQMHYIMNKDFTKKTSNLKSAFRKRILEKLGYKFLEFQVDLFVEGNYEFLKVIQKEFNNYSVGSLKDASL